jgi:hypothetical protein
LYMIIGSFRRDFLHVKYKRKYIYNTLNDVVAPPCVADMQLECNKGHSASTSRLLPDM